jgi:hypothetical protein
MGVGSGGSEAVGLGALVGIRLSPLGAPPTHPVVVFIIAVSLMFPEVSKLPTVICCLVPQSFTRIDCALTHFPFKLFTSQVSLMFFFFSKFHVS